MHRDDDAQRGSLHDRCRLCHQFKPMVMGIIYGLTHRPVRGALLHAALMVSLPYVH